MKNHTAKKRIQQLLSLLSTLFIALFASPLQAAAGEEATGGEVGKSLFKKLSDVFNNYDTSSLWYTVVFLMLFLGFSTGYRMGAIWQIILFIGALLFPFLISYVKLPISYFLGKVGISKEDSWISLIVMVLILSVFFYLLTLAKKVCRGIFRLFLLRPFDSLLGGVIGIIFTIAELGCLLIFLKAAGLLTSEDLLFYKEMCFFTEKIHRVAWIDSIKALGDSLKEFAQSGG